MACKPPVDYANPRSVAELAEPLRSRIAQAIADAPTGGLILVSGRRSDYQQWLLRHERCPGNECNMAVCKGSPVTAVPGKSNHRNTDSTHCAADMGGRELQWLINNREKYGLALTVRTENWHFEPNKVDVRTGRVHNRPTVPIKPYGQAVEPNKGRTWKPFRAGATDESIYKAGGLDNEVTELQLRLKARGLYKDAIDGDYGPKSQAAVTAFKKQIIQLQKMTKQAVWPNSDTSVGKKTIDMLRWWSA